MDAFSDYTTSSVRRAVTGSSCNGLVKGIIAGWNAVKKRGEHEKWHSQKSSRKENKKEDTSESDLRSCKAT